MAEEINLNRGPVKSDKQDTNKEAEKAEKEIPELPDDVTPEQLLDSIIAAPTESLIPWEECTLPSNGLYYGWPDGLVKVRPMTQAAEKVLANRRLVQSGQSIDYLFRECCQFPNNFDPAELLVGDRIFLLYFLRGITHGNLYEFVVTCPHCDASNIQTYDLNELASTIIPAKPELGEEPFKVTLPYVSEKLGKDIWVELRFLRAYDINDIINQRRMRKKMFSKAKSRRRLQQQQQQEVHVADAEDDLMENLDKIVVSILGVRNPEKIKQFMNKLHAKDAATIREWLRDNTPGIDSTVDITCPSCDNEFSIDLPISDSFFRPAKSRRV